MAALKKYTSFEALKASEKSGNVTTGKSNHFVEFETFLKHMQTAYSNKKKARTENGKQPTR